MTRASSILLLIALAACTHPLELGERRYREGDRLAALEIWRNVGDDSFSHDAVQERIAEVERELANLVVLFRKRGGYYESKGRIAESVLNYRLALKLQPDDRATLDRVQLLARKLVVLREKTRETYAEAFETGDLAASRRHLAALRTLDPFDARLATDERQFENALQAAVEPLLDEGRQAVEYGDPVRARRAFFAVLRLDPENKTALGRLANMPRPSQRIEKGQTVVVVPARQPTAEEIQADGLFQIALLADQAGNPFRAIAADIEALEVNPEHAGASEHLAELRSRFSVEELILEGRDYYQQEDLDAALEKWRDALLIDPESTQAAEYVARAERLLENLERLRAQPVAGVKAP